ncbi:hypothetical protein GCM10009096_01560 [Parasphingorhabdus litoris]|uniref:Restriction endonuclease n=1 Tax=Parasphingorhabdus litoris TaxID=394733 RepID=A0ABP3JYF7_9SPHN
MGENPGEDQITINLIARFHLDETIRKIFHHWEYQFEPFGEDESGASFSKGKIDFAVFWDLEREKYLAYEAKRLNVTSKNGFASLATVYVTEGLIRFVTEQYSEGLPVGCMIGYVIDGNIASVHPKIEKAISDKSTLVGLISGPTDLPSIAKSTRFETDHKRKKGSSKINIRHALVSC